MKTARVKIVNVRPKLKVVEAENLCAYAAPELREIADAAERGEISEIIYGVAYKGRAVHFDFYGNSSLSALGLCSRMERIIHAHWDKPK